MKLLRIATSLTIAAFTPIAAVASETASAADAQDRLKSIVTGVKVNGGSTTAKSLMAADDPNKCKFKDMVCLLADVKAATLLAHSAIPKLAGSPLVNDMLDVDGVSINQQLFGPAGKGKDKWETRYKFARPDTKKIVGRQAFCEKVGDVHVACVSISN